MKRAIVIVAIIAACLAQTIKLTGCSPIAGGFILGLMLASGNTEDLIATSVSPDGRNTLEAYCADGGATTDFAVKVYEKTDVGKKKIYHQYHQKDVVINWESDNVVNINGVKLDLSKGETYKSYDYPSRYDLPVNE